jgi:pyridoxine kinase
VVSAAETLGPARVLVTSAPAMMAGSTGNLLVSGGNARMAEHRLIPDAPNGLGDLMSASFLARLLEGLSEEKALQMATAAVFEILARTARRGADELMLETDAQSLRTPMAMVNMRRMVSASGRKKP